MIWREGSRIWRDGSRIAIRNLSTQHQLARFQIYSASGVVVLALCVSVAKYDTFERNLDNKLKSRPALS